VRGGGMVGNVDPVAEKQPKIAPQKVGSGTAR